MSSARDAESSWNPPDQGDRRLPEPKTWARVSPTRAGRCIMTVVIIIIKPSATAGLRHTLTVSMIRSQLVPIRLDMFLQRFAKAPRPSLFPGRQFTRSLSTPPPSHPRWHKLGRRSAYVAATLGTLWFLDQQFNASAVRRNLRTIWAVSVPPRLSVHSQSGFGTSVPSFIGADHFRTCRRPVRHRKQAVAP